MLVTKMKVRSAEHAAGRYRNEHTFQFSNSTNFNECIIYGNKAMYTMSTEQ